MREITAKKLPCECLNASKLETLLSFRRSLRNERVKSYQIMCFLKLKKYLESVVKSQNIVEQVNSNPNNISPTICR